MQHWSLELHRCENKLLCSHANIVPTLVMPVEIGKEVFMFQSLFFTEELASTPPSSEVMEMEVFF